MKNIYKNYLWVAATFLLSLLFISCSSNDNNDIISPADETSGLIKIQEFPNENYSISLYTKTGKLTTGYNEIYLQIKNKITGEFEKNASLSWNPVMHMTSKSHSSPYSSIEKISNKQTLYKGFIIFQMAANDSEYWELKLQYILNGQTDQITEKIPVLNSKKRRVEVFTGTNNNRYILALAEPSAPFVGLNDITAYLYKMQDMQTFIPVEGYTIKIDPRMPGMGNHSSPNNLDLTQIDSGFYKGKLSLTMTGYWNINLIVLDSASQILKGEPITEINKASSIFFEIEF